MIIPRNTNLDKLICRKGNGLVKIMTGLRRCGKSFLLMNLFKEDLLKSGIKKENILSLDFESGENKAYRNLDRLQTYLTAQIQGKEGPLID